MTSIGSIRSGDKGVGVYITKGSMDPEIENCGQFRNFIVRLHAEDSRSHFEWKAFWREAWHWPRAAAQSTRFCHV